jgi:hypothetical protein
MAAGAYSNNAAETTTHGGWVFDLPNTTGTLTFALQADGEIPATFSSYGPTIETTGVAFPDACTGSNISGAGTVTTVSALGASQSQVSVTSLSTTVPITIFDKTSTSFYLTNTGFLSINDTVFGNISAIDIIPNDPSSDVNNGPPPYSLLPFWANMDTRLDSTYLSVGSGSVCYVTSGTSPSQSLWVSWDNMYLRTGGSTLINQRQSFTLEYDQATGNVTYYYAQPTVSSGSVGSNQLGGAASIGIAGNQTTTGGTGFQAETFENAWMTNTSSNFAYKIVLAAD